MLLEREQPLQQLLELASQAGAGRGNIALVGGEAGIGKTSLLSAMRDHLGKQSKLLWGGCDALFTPRPLGPLHDMAPLLSDTLRQQLLQGVESVQLYSSMLEELDASGKAKNTGTVLVFEDAHWADYATLDLLNYLGRRISMLPALLIISFRNDEVHDDHPLTRVLGDLPSAHTSRIDLQALSREAVESLGVPSGYTLDSLYNITSGNPFFVTELMECSHNPEAVIPASIKDAVSARLVRLSLPERNLLETLSVIPGNVPFNILPALFGENGETLAMACIGRNLLVQESNESLRFRHELSRLAVLARISSTKQKEFHGRVLDALLETQNHATARPGFDRLVHHAAGAFDVKRVLEFAPKAAKVAATVGAHREAAAHLATALRFVNDAPTELAAELYENWAYEAGLALRIDDEVLEARRHAITLWRALGRTEKVGENLRWLSRLHWYRGEAAEAGHYADDAIRELESTPPSAERAMAYSLRSQMHMLNDRMDESIVWGEKALQLAEEYKNTEVKLHALNNLGTARVFRNNTDGIAELEESLALALNEGFHEHAARVYTNLSEYAVEFRNFELAEDVLSKGIAYNTQYDLFADSHYMLGRQALLRMEQGRLSDAETIASGVIKTEQSTTLLMRLPALTVLAITRLRLGAENAYESLSQALSDALATGELQNIVPVRLGLIESAWLNDKVQNAKEHLDYLNELGVSRMHYWRVGETAVWAHRLNYALDKDFYRDLPEPHRLEIGGDCEKAATEWENLGLPYAAAISLMQTRNSKNMAVAFGKAQTILEKIGAKQALLKLNNIALEKGVLDTMPRARRGPYKAAKNHPIGLTKREQQILRLISKGAHNKEIAEVLSRSQRTIEHHVSSLLTKLNASSRMEAMLRVHNEPWLLPDETEN